MEHRHPVCRTWSRSWNCVLIYISLFIISVTLLKYDFVSKETGCILGLNLRLYTGCVMYLPVTDFVSDIMQCPRGLRTNQVEQFIREKQSDCSNDNFMSILCPNL